MKKKKLSIYQAYQDYQVYDEQNYTSKRLGKGVGLAINDKLSEDELNGLVKKYSNVGWFKTYCQYAPEIKKTWLFIAY